MFEQLVLSYFTIDIYDILIIQDTDGELLSIKIEEYEPERTEAKYIANDEVIH